MFIFALPLIPFFQYYEAVTRGLEITKWYTKRNSGSRHYLQFLFALHALNNV